jgi:hypothetical protein
MDALTTQLLKQLSGGGLAQIGQQIGADEKTTGAALSTVMPMLVSALAANASKPDGADALHRALAADHDGSIFDDLAGFLGNPQAANGAGILGHILGNRQPAVTKGLAKGTGLDMNQIGNLLKIAAPMLMGMLGKQQLKKGFDVGSLTSFLGGQQKKVQKANPGLMGTLGSLLDANGDGSAADDILGMVGKLFRK